MGKYYATAIVGVILIVGMMLMNNSMMQKADKYAASKSKIEGRKTTVDNDLPLVNEFVIATWKDNRYHKKSCVQIKGPQDEILFSDAIRFECDPCPWCMKDKQ